MHTTRASIRVLGLTLVLAAQAPSTGCAGTPARTALSAPLPCVGPGIVICRGGYATRTDPPFLVGGRICAC